MKRPINKIAAEILSSWGPPPFPVSPNYMVWSQPYVEAMLSLETIEDNYGLDTAEEVVQRFLINATNWRGPVAKRIKAELNQLLKDNHAHSVRR